MNMKTNWKKIAYASLALILIIGIVLFSKAILATLGIIAGTIGLIGLGLLVLTFVCLFASEIKPESRFSRGWKPSLQIGLCLVIAAIILWVLLPWLDAQKTVNQNQTPATSETSKPQSHSLGLPADLKDVDQNVWDKPLEAGVMVDGNGNAVYTQTGKDGSFLLKGKIYEGQVLVLDSNKLSKTIEGKVESYSNGNLLIIVGPYDLDADPISYTDGGAQPVGRTELQSFLDNNIAVKFARGNWDEKKNQWSYQPWALTHFWLPDGIKYNKLTLTHETDTYPGRDNAPTMTNTK